MSHQLEFEFAKVCYVVVFNLGHLDSLPASQPMIFAKEEPHNDHHHYRL
jgi:hypothetical protein